MTALEVFALIFGLLALGPLLAPAAVFVLILLMPRGRF